MVFDRKEGRARFLSQGLRTVTVDVAGGRHLGDQYREKSFLGSKEVVLTFDDGPHPRYTRAILKTLKEHGVKATFFILGENAQAHPDVVKEIAAQGHTIGTHTFSHANLRRRSPEKMQAQIEYGLSAVAEAAGRPISPFFRFPYLNDTKAGMRYLDSRNLGVFGVHADSKDYETRSGQVMKQHTLAELQKTGGGIILFHDIQPSTAKGLDGLLTEMETRGYKFVHMAPAEMAATLPAYDRKVAMGDVPKKTAPQHVHTYAPPAATRKVATAAWPSAPKKHKQALL